MSDEDQIKATMSDQLELRKEQIQSVKDTASAATGLATTQKAREAAEQGEIEALAAIAEIQSEMILIEEQGQVKLDQLKESNHQKQLQRESKESAEAEKQEKERIAAIQKEAQMIGEIGKLTIGTFSNSIEAIQTTAKAAGVENEGLIRALFEMNKIAALGEIAFNTAKAITAAGAMGPLAPLAIAAAVAQAAAQTAVVASQQAPKLHMGGMTPDEQTVVVKTGEAVLDASTVNRLGGESGINALQNGQGTSPQVIVTNPYKHFDRFRYDRQRAGLSSRSSRRSY